MANPGVGTKFLSVNLNKSYGQSHHQHHNNQHNLSHLGHHGSNRSRPGGGAGGGGGMVVLSRPRSSQKATGPKLSVPPPLNLPSLRKEHERFDSLGSTGGSAGGGVSGGGQRPGSSGMGWTKPGTAVALQQKGGIVIGNHVTDDGVDQGLHGVDGVSKVSGSSGTYMPPSLRSGLVEPPSSTFPHVEKVSVLRGEDFPSLRAALPSLSVSEKKHRDGLNQKQKQAMGEEYGNSDQNHGSRLNSLVDVHPRLKSGGFDNGLSENGGRNRDLGGSGGSEQIRKQDEYFPGPLPLVRLNPRSDWADDERDTGHGFAVQNRDHGSSRSEAYRDRDFDMPRPSGLPHKPAHNVFDKWSQHDNETGKVSSSEVTEVDPFGRDTRTPGREGQERNLWRASPPIQKDAFGAQEFGNDRNSFGARPYSQNREAIRENKLVSSSFRDLPSDDFGKRDLGHGQAGRQPWNNTWHSSYSQRAERNDQYNKFRGDSFQNNSVSKSSLSSGGRGLPVNDPILNFGRDKRAAMKSDKPYLEDPFMKDFGATSFDVRDPFSGGLVGVVKKKKDLKQTDFHDPVRESFEAELERVQKMQEQERQRIIEEQERALDLARREEEERLRVAREQEEQRRRLEEEVRETAWRAEQERLEAMRKAEEQRIARDEEKQRIIMEEERRKQAAKQKLLELEERIAKRQVEGTKCGSNSSILAEEKISGMSPKVADLADWEDGERIVERITTSASSDSSGLNRAFDFSNSPHFARDNSSALLERGKPVNSWRRDAFENGNSSTFFPQESDNGHFSPRRGGTIGGKSFPRKDYFGGPGFMSSRTYYKAGIQELHTDEVNHPRSQRWNIPGDGDHYARNVEVESDFHENYTEGYSDVGWGHGRYHSNPYPSYPERLYQNPDIDGLSSSGRSRYSMRHPRVLPPPSRSAMQKTFYRHENEQPGPSNFQENEIEYNHAERSETTGKIGFESSDQHNLAQPEIIDVQLENTANLEQKMDRNTTPRCDSQSSLSVSSPPDSPVHLSHDDLDESGDSPALSANEDTDISPGRGNDPVMLPMESRKENTMIHSSSVSVDDEEWTIENERLQEQEEYDEDEDGYEEEDEIHDGDDENINLTREFKDMHLVEKISPDMVNNVVLGFNEGVEVAMPTDEIERRPQNEESSFSAPTAVVEGLGYFDVVCGTLHSADVPSKASTGDSSRIFREAENAIQDLVIQPSSTQLSAVSELMVHVDANSDSVVSNLQPISSSVDITSHSSSNQTVTSAISAGPCQAEPPVKLQFGLFSGPSLIPSPIPAIQIGSIQMPLLHPQVGPSLAHMHPSQSSLFQFGQWRYSSPISQGVLPLAPQSAPLVQSNISATFSMTQNAAVSQPILSSSETSLNLMKSDALSLSVDNQPGLAQRCLDLSEGNVLNKVTSLPASERAETTFTAQQDCPEVSHLGEEKTGSDSGLRVQDRGHHISVMRNFKSLSKESENLLQTRAASSLSGSKEKMLNVPKTQGLISGGRSKKYVVSVRNNTGSKSSFVAPETSRSDSGGFQRRPRHQRTEFRVRENTDKQLYTGVASTNQIALDDKSNINGRGTGFSTRSEYRRVIVSNKSSKQMNESESMNSGITSSQEIDSGGKTGKGVRRGSSTKSKNIPHFVEGNLKRTIRSEEDVDTPLQSGVVRVFEQPGIEAPSDEDDFIEVRSKRQMLNDRREQREKEIKAKSRFTKMPRKSRSTSQNSLVSASSNKISVSMSEAANDVPPDFVATDGRNSANLEVSTGFGATKVSQLLAPIGTPAVKTEVQADIRPQTIKCLQKSSVSVLSGGEKNLASGFIFDSKNKVLDNVQTPMSLWGNSRLDQQVMALSQNQLDEAMNPGQFDSRVSSKDHSSVGKPSIPSSTILTEDKSFSSAASPINSLLAGEKIQFGAVTSPTVLPPSTRAVSHGIGPPGLGRSEHEIAHNISAAKNDRTIFFDKEKHSNETCVNLEDSEAEAAASAIAVAAISSDEIVGNGLGTCSVSASEAISIGCAEIDGVAGAGDKQSVSQSKAEESLTVALPADLSVETPPISLWPPLPSPPNSSSQMVSHFAGGPPSHFPFYEMNPMLGGPIFTFGPHDESAPSQSPTQKSSTPSSTPLRTWQQCHSGVDSFYGAPTGYAGPFISPSGGLPGVQGPPHMVVYNHFAPVGQFGQVGLSFMGTTYIPSAKQPDWKQHPVSSAMGFGEGEVNNLNMIAAQHNPTNLTAPIQHLAPGSPLMPMASTLAMFDVSPFQSASDMSVQAHWSNVTAAPHQPVSISMPLQQQPDGVLPLQYNYGPPVDQSSNANRSQTSTPSDSSRNFHAASDATVTQLPDELGLVDSASSTGPGTSTQNVVAKSLSLSTITDAGKSDIVQNSSSSNVPQSSQQKNTSSHQYNSSSGYSYQRGSGISQKNSSGGEWSHRRIGFHGRNQSLSAEKGFGPAKMKQIYVAKQTTSGTSAPS